MKSRIIAILMTAVIFSTATQCGKSADAPASEATEAAQEAEQPVDGQETEQTEETQEEAQEAVTEAQDDGHVSDNPLLNAEKVVNDATNGSGQKIGEWESVLITAEILDAITPEQLYEFASTEVEGSGFNWITLMAADGRGIQFTGSMIQMATYGIVDDQGRIIEDQGTWKLSGNTYEFISAENY